MIQEHLGTVFSVTCNDAEQEEQGCSVHLVIWRQTSLQWDGPGLLK